MSILDFAINHIRQGRHVFPGIPNEKVPAIKDPYLHATLDEKQVLRWWTENPNYNICIPAGIEIEPGKFLGVIDVDTKKMNGFETIEKLDAIGLEFCETLEQITPSKGLHKLYYFDSPIGNGVNSIGPGVDHRGFHGYVLGAGSWYHGKEYTFKDEGIGIAQAPEWLSKRCLRTGSPRGPTGASNRPLSIVHNINADTANGRARVFLATLETAREGERNQRGFETACRLKDFGCTKAGTVDLLVTDWKCEPGLDENEIESVVNSAFQYGQNPPGSQAPEVVFSPLPPPPKPKNPYEAMNEKYAFVVAGDGVKILWDTTNAKGKKEIRHLSLPAFHDKEANNTMWVGKKEMAVSKEWLKWKGRKSFDGIVFDPTNKHDPRFFNLWQGFAVKRFIESETPTPEAIKSFELFIEHIHENVCGKDPDLTNWLLSYFAHMIQKPHEKPRVALAFRGKKGVGKNVIATCLGRLLGSHYLVAANRRYLSGNFNGHLENLLLFVLDEAYWSGDKATEGILKDLVTGNTHLIERKGHEAYTVDNLARIVIFGNEEWIVPASDDERRYAVFEIGEKRRRDDAYFGQILDGMKDGGDRLLFQYLLDLDSTVDINHAPDTKALMGQKEQSLGLFQGWWFQCLKSGRLIGGQIDGWPKEVARFEFRDAFSREMAAQSIRSRLPNENHIGRQFKTVAPTSWRTRQENAGGRVYCFASLELARQEWEAFMGGKVDWD